LRRLTVALDALAALRAAGGAREVDLCAAAVLAELAGADAVSLGVSEEGGPGEGDAADLRRAARGFELHVPPTQPLLKLALELRPDRVVLASLERDERGGGLPLDFRSPAAPLAAAVRTLHEAGIPASALVQPEHEAVKAAYQCEFRGVDLWTSAVVELPGRERAQAGQRLADAVRLAAKLRLPVTLAGGLGPRSLTEVLALAPSAERVVVGRALAARALLLGLDRAVRDLRESLG
jgi:pyridoxine 5-phosphate synthase